MEAWTGPIGRAALAAVAALAAGVGWPAQAAERSRSPTVSELVVTATKAVSELTVTAKARCLSPQNGGGRAERPRVMDAFPARGAVVRPGLLVVRITFDRPMACEGTFDPAPPLANPCPGANREMLLSYDRKTVRTICVVEPGAQYGYSLGEDPVAKTFLGLDGLPAAPARIAFATSDGPVISDVCEALSQDAATAAEMRRRGQACARAR